MSQVIHAIAVSAELFKLPTAHSVHGKSACRKHILQHYNFLTVSRRAHLDVQTSLLALAGDDVSQIVDTELLCKLVEHAHLAIVGWVVNGQLDAAHLYAQTRNSGL